MDFFKKQNDKISRGEISGPGTHYIHLDTLGLINACVDDSVQSAAYSFFAWNNTYGLSAINETTKHGQLYELYRPGGLLEQIGECERLSTALEASEEPDIDAGYVEAYCRNASEHATTTLIVPYAETGERGWFDVTHPWADPFPPNYHIGWLNQHWVQRALGVPVNFTWMSPVVSTAFEDHGDMPRGGRGRLAGLAGLLDAGVKVHLVYGDRDYACNWIGGEAASLAIPHRHRAGFAAAGYAALTVGPPDRAPLVPYGLTRQHGNLSFTRVYQAGHMVPSYQPEASLRVFERALFNRDIATGAVDLTATGGWARGAGEVFGTEGPADTWWRRNEVMPVPEASCYTLTISTCSTEEKEALRNGTAIVENYKLVGIKGAEGGYGGGSFYGGDGQQSILGDVEEL